MSQTDIARLLLIGGALLFVTMRWSHESYEIISDAQWMAPRWLRVIFSSNGGQLVLAALAVQLWALAAFVVGALVLSGFFSSSFGTVAIGAILLPGLMVVAFTWVALKVRDYLR
jgi:hypothetical protein